MLRDAAEPVLEWTERLTPLAYRERRTATAALAIGDTVALEASIYLAYLIRLFATRWFPADLTGSSFLGIFGGVLVVPLVFRFVGLYPGYGLTDVERMRKQLLGVTIVFCSLLIWDYLAQDNRWSRGVLLAAWAITAITLPHVFWFIRWLLERTGRWGTPVVVVGAGAPARKLVRTLRADSELGLVPVAIVDAARQIAERSIEDVPVLDSDFLESGPAARIRTAILAMPELGGKRLAELSVALRFPHVIVLPELENLQTSWVSVRDIDGVLGLEIRRNLLLRHNRIIKRVFDYAVTVPLLIATFPVLAMSAALIALIDPGRPIYTQERRGLGGRTISIFKLRTMYRDADRRLERFLGDDPRARREWKQYFKLRDDPRIIPWIGKTLRASSIDELPQLWNVLRGEMSLIGPRPLPEYHLEKLSASHQALRFDVRPGLTGLWQTKLRSDGDIETLEKLDTYYIRNWSLWMDMYILLKTLPVVLTGKGAR